MTKNVSSLKQVDDLRKWAEARVPEPVDSIYWMSEIEVKKLVHELEVHQIELEMQNEALQKSQVETADEHRKYADLYNFAPVGYFTFDIKGHIIEANVTGASLLGFEKRSLIGQPFQRFICTGHFSMFQSHLQKALDKPCKQTYKLKLVKKDGSSFDAQIDTIAITDGEGKFDQYRSSVSDITEQNLMEEKVKESEKKFFSAFHNAPVSMSISTLHEGRFLDVNEEFLHTLGRSREEMVGQTSRDQDIWVDPERRKEFIETIQQKGKLRGYDARIRTKSGEVRDMLWSAELVSLNNIPCLIASAVDITESKRAEAALQESERRFRAIADYTYDWENWLGLDGKLIWVNPAVFRFTGYLAEECLAMNNYPLPLIDDVDQERFIQHHTAAVQGASANDVEFRIRCKDGALKWAAVSYQPIYDSKGASLGHRSSLRDISGRKQLEEKLIKSEKQYRTMVNNLPIGVYQVGIDGKFIFANQEFVRIMDCDSIEELMNSNVVHLYKNPKDRLVFLYTIRESGIIRNYEIEILTKRGVSKTILINGFIEGDHISGTVVDIVERKRAEEALRESEKKYRALVETTNTGFVILDRAGRVLDANQEYVRLTGHRDLKQILGRNVIEWTADYEKERNRESVRKCFEKGHIRNLEIDYMDSQGNATPIEINATLVEIKGIPQILTICHDIANRKLMVDALRKSEEHYRSLVESTKDSIYLLDRDLRYLFANSAYLSRLGLTLQQLIGQSYSELHPLPNDAFPESVNHVFKTGECTEFEYESVRDKKPFLRTLGPVKGVHGETIAVTVISKNVSTLKDAEKALRSYQDQLRALLGRVQAAREEERAMIAREIHDEMGGALTGLKLDLSFLVSKAPKTRDKTKRDSFLKQVDNMTKLIEETIGKVRRIITDLRPSILDDFGLLAAIEWQLKDFEKRTGIQCEFISTMENINLDKDRCTAVFRIFQESLTNVVRHASATKVAVRLYEEKDSLILKVEDNGKGISKLLIHDKTSFGLLGMRERALFLGGIVNISGEPWKGTTVSVEIPLGRE